jgi:hypothetical protein
VQGELPLDVAVATVWSTWTEASLQAFVRRTAHITGWLVYHTAFSMKSDAGFPDLVLVKERIVYAELKRENLWPTEGHLSTGAVPKWVNGQREWLTALADAGAEVYLWWPSDTTDIATILTSGPDEEMACVRRIRGYLGADAPEDLAGAAAAPALVGGGR